MSGPLRVIVVSPDAGVARHLVYAQAAMADCLARGEAPFPGRALLDLGDELARIATTPDAGAAAALAWGDVAAATVVYEDLGISAGMMVGIEHAYKAGRTVEYRSLAAWRLEGES